MAERGSRPLPLSPRMMTVSQCSPSTLPERGSPSSPAKYALLTSRREPLVHSGNNPSHENHRIEDTIDTTLWREQACTREPCLPQPPMNDRNGGNNFGHGLAKQSASELASEKVVELPGQHEVLASESPTQKSGGGVTHVDSACATLIDECVTATNECELQVDCERATEVEGESATQLDERALRKDQIGERADEREDECAALVSERVASVDESTTQVNECATQRENECAIHAGVCAASQVNEDGCDREDNAPAPRLLGANSRDETSICSTQRSSSRFDFKGSFPLSPRLRLGLRKKSKKEVDMDKADKPSVSGGEMSEDWLSEVTEKEQTVVEGYLSIKLHIRRRRFCVLRGSSLTIYKSAAEFALGAKPQKYFEVLSARDSDAFGSAAKSTFYGPSSLPHSFLFICRGKKVLAAGADGPEWKKRWLSALEHFPCEGSSDCEAGELPANTEMEASWKELRQSESGTESASEAPQRRLSRSKQRRSKEESKSVSQQCGASLSVSDHAIAKVDRSRRQSNTMEGLSESLYADTFDTHTAVLLLHRYLNNPLAIEAVIERFEEYGQRHIDEVEFYLPQLVHLLLLAPPSTADKLSDMILRLTTGPGSRDSQIPVHLALQTAWHLQTFIHDPSVPYYNLCAQLLLQIEAAMVDQRSGMAKARSLENLLHIPGLKEKIFGRPNIAPTLLAKDGQKTQYGGQSEGTFTSVSSSPESDANISSKRDSESKTPEREERETDSVDPAPSALPSSTESVCHSTELESKAHGDAPSCLSEGERHKLREWLTVERRQRHEMLVAERDFVQALTDVAEKLRMVQPVPQRKKLLPQELSQLKVPSRAYIPLCHSTDSFTQILRVLPNEGTVFSTHSRAPCLICFEVVREPPAAAALSSVSEKLRRVFHVSRGAHGERSSPVHEMERHQAGQGSAKIEAQRHQVSEESTESSSSASSELTSDRASARPPHCYSDSNVMFHTEGAEKELAFVAGSDDTHTKKDKTDKKEKKHQSPSSTASLTTYPSFSSFTSLTGRQSTSSRKPRRHSLSSLRKTWKRRFSGAQGGSLGYCSPQQQQEEDVAGAVHVLQGRNKFFGAGEDQGSSRSPLLGFLYGRNRSLSTNSIFGSSSSLLDEQNEIAGLVQMNCDSEGEDSDCESQGSHADEEEAENFWIRSMKLSKSRRSKDTREREGKSGSVGANVSGAEAVPYTGSEDSRPLSPRKKWLEDTDTSAAGESSAAVTSEKKYKLTACKASVQGQDVGNSNDSGATLKTSENLRITFGNDAARTLRKSERQNAIEVGESSSCTSRHQNNSQLTETDSDPISSSTEGRSTVPGNSPRPPLRSPLASVPLSPTASLLSTGTSDFEPDCTLSQDNIEFRLADLSDRIIKKRLMSQDMRRRSVKAFEQSMSKIFAGITANQESWEAKKERIRKESEFGHLRGWDILSVIAKSFDDMRQEVFALQLISKFQEIFEKSQLPLYLRPYRIVSTGHEVGLIETITDANSIDGLKKQEGYTTLKQHFIDTFGPEDSPSFLTAQKRYIESVAAYSLVCYLLQIKDRHNGNIMLTKEGRLIHIDFGFLLGIAPGGNFSIEVAPFKLTGEMVDAMGGLKSDGYQYFKCLLAQGMLAAQRNADQILVLVEIMMSNSTFPCFKGRDGAKILRKLRSRFFLDYDKEMTVKAVMKLIKDSHKNKWTYRYDTFQRLTNGIAP